MVEDTTKPIKQDAPRPSLNALFARLTNEGRALLRAELRLLRTRASEKASSVGIILGLVAGAIMLGQAVLVAVLVGLIIILGPLVGAGWATVIVAGIVLVLIAGCGLVARAKIAALLTPQDPL